MTSKFNTSLRLLILTILFVAWQRPVSATPYLVMDSYPWGQTTDQTCMNAVFGAGGWIQANYATPAATIFQASTQFVMLEGSESNSGMPPFINANITTIENWVNNGGRLFINAGPNYGTNQTWGFGGTQLIYPSYANTVTTSVPGNQIFLGPFLPTATTYTGSSFGHAYVSGTGLTTLLYDAAFAANARPVICYKQWGNGIVFFGGATLPFAWSPNPQGTNIWQNIFSYVNTFPLVGITTTVSGAPWCAGANITVNYSTLNLAFVAGNQFKVQLSDATGSFASPTQIGIITSTATSGAIACTIPAAQPGGTAYRIRTVSTSAAFTGADNGTNLTINPQLVPAVTITANPGNNVCAGTSVTFTSALTNGGPSPTYQWKVNGVPVPLATNPSYTTTTLTNGNTVTCDIVSNATCATPTTATSNTITMTINPLITPTVTVSSVPAANSVCVGQPVTFTATITNGGPGPVYQWYKNGNPVGTNSTTYVDAVLTNNDVITCQLTSNAPCLLVNPVTSAPITVTVNPNVTPGVSITANPGNTACAGSNVTFTATPVNGGPTPSYQWYIGATPVGSNSPTYSSTTLVTGNAVKCVMTGNAPCSSPATATSNIITMTINPVVTPTISLSANPGNTICIGTSTTFTATITNGGPSPTYQWTVNNVSAGANSNTFTTNTLANGDVVKCTMISSAPCPTPASVNSSITMTVNNTLPASVGITATPGNSVCAGSLTTFTAAPVNGGPTPAYQWYKNGIPVGANNPVYTDNSLNTGDLLNCTMTSSAVCATPAVATSNDITMLVNPTVAPSISISNNTGNTICAGTGVTFAASTTNPGNAPQYQWYLNGNPVGGNSASYINNALNNNDAIYCTMTSNAVCATPASVTSGTITMTVNPLSVPSVSISVLPGNTICSGTLATFTATPVNGGPLPGYQWYKNGVPVGTGPTYSDNALNNTDLINCVMGSSAVCATPPNVYSNSITMTVIGNVAPGVTVTAVPGNTICSGSLATFNTQIVNGGPTPVYVWKVNNNPVGGNTPSYSSTALNNGDVVTCELTSSYGCAVPLTVTSTPTTMTVNAVVNPFISIVNNSSDTICKNALASFTATPVNGGPNPVFVWRKNGGPVGNPSPTYSDNNLSNGDIITCDLISSDPCPVPAIANSNFHTVTVNEWMTPKVYLNADPSVLTCSGSPITFNATVDSAGLPTDLSYQWMLNGNPVGANNPSYTGNMLNGGDMIYYIMTSSALCLTKTTDTSSIDTVKWFNSGYLAGVTGTTESNTVNIATNNMLKVGYTDCDLISSIKPTGANPVAGIAEFKVTLDPQIQTYNAQPYVQRHFDIVPQNNASTATATVELYAYPNEFVAYNNYIATANRYYPPLPTNGINNGNVRITVFHGTGTAPGNYTGPTQEVVPTVSWDIANNWWVMSFQATGFSGYYIHTGEPLSVSNTASAGGFDMEAYPNPVMDKVEVKLTGTRAANSSLVVTDLTGRTLINVDMDNNKAIIDMSGLASGMYMLRYTDDTRTQTVKITKQ